MSFGHKFTRCWRKPGTRSRIGRKTAGETQPHAIVSARLGIFDLPSVQGKLPFYWYLSSNVPTTRKYLMTIGRPLLSGSETQLTSSPPHIRISPIPSSINCRMLRTISTLPIRRSWFGQCESFCWAKWDHDDLELIEKDLLCNRVGRRDSCRRVAQRGWPVAVDSEKWVFVPAPPPVETVPSGHRSNR